MYNENTIIIDSSSYKRRRRKKLKIFCVLCFPKVQLDCIKPESEENRYKCPRCKNTYQLGFEILPQEDELESSHEDEDFEDSDSVRLLTADNEFTDDEDDDNNDSTIPVPKYMKSGPGIKVEFKEIINED